MSFPQVAASNTSKQDSAVTSHTVDLPSGIVSGNLLLCLFATDGSNTLTWPEGWTEVFSEDYSGNVHISVAFRNADGSEGSTITVTSTASQGSAHVTFRISGHEPGSDPEVSSGAQGTSTTPDPDSLTPSWGAEDTLWIAVEGTGNTNAVTGYPFDDNQHVVYAMTDYCSLGVCSDELHEASVNPGTFTTTFTYEWLACTVGVRPLAKIGKSGRHREIRIRKVPHYAGMGRF